MYWYSNPWTWRYWLWLAASAALSAIIAWVAIAYARRRALLDLPGRRRSHVLPTPRGAGIGIAIAALAATMALMHAAPILGAQWRLIIALTLVAAIGWIDDHRPLPAWLRLVVHCIAVAVWLLPLLESLLPGILVEPRFDAYFWHNAAIALLLGFLSVWSINLHNFMDGIDGILATQAIFVLTVLSVLCLRDAISPRHLLIALWAAAIVGFLPFNFPRARAFMGDVGSGSVGLLIAVAAIWQNTSPYSAACSGLVACSAFVTDASCTLISRWLRGRRWYRPHREHLYQWLTRAGLSHSAVVAGYTAWNLAVVVPVLYWMNLRPSGAPPAPGFAATASLYAVAIVIWFLGKHWCLRKVASGKAHVRA
jgi:UDP-N-acetylmuramyl pentapeptide phosphotransferase/UDP-N-acetylglucosamine-1-phosphate transferase